MIAIGAIRTEMAMTTRIDLEAHEFCLALPEMPPDRFAELVADISKRGLRHPIALYEGKVLDGRHRYRACIEAGVEPRFEEFDGDDPCAFVISENMKRRDLTKAQRFKVYVKLKNVERLREKAKQAAKAGNALGGRGGAKSLAAVANNCEETGTAAPQHTHVEVAKAIDVSPRLAQDMLTIDGRGTDADWEDVDSGKASVSAKAKEVRERTKPKVAKPADATDAPKCRKRGRRHQLPAEVPAEVRAWGEAMEPTSMRAEAPRRRALSVDLTAAAREVVADPDAHRAILRELLNLDSPYKVADLLIEALSHRPHFAQDVANAMLDRVVWAHRSAEAELGREGRQ